MLIEKPAFSSIKTSPSFTQISLVDLSFKVIVGSTGFIVSILIFEKSVARPSSKESFTEFPAESFTVVLVIPVILRLVVSSCELIVYFENNVLDPTCVVSKLSEFKILPSN